MEVIIDGVRYEPVKEYSFASGVLTKALELRFLSETLNETISVREYIYRLMSELWREGETFSGKYALGNSGWQYELYTPLIKEFYISGELTEDGYIEKMDRKDADRFIQNLIKHMCFGNK